MSHDEIQILAEQLGAARGESPPDILELAGLAGLLGRLDPEHAALAGLTLELDSDLRTDLAHSAQDLSQGVEDCDEDDPPEVTWDRLCALDELCAAAHWLGAAETVAPYIEGVHATLSAFPEPWAPHADAASALLQHRPPRPGDPALQLWQVVESASLGFRSDPSAEAGAPSAFRIEVGLDVVVELFGMRAEARRAAASELPEPPPWRTLREAEDWSAGLTVEDGDVWLVVQAGIEDSKSPVTATCDGAPVALAPHLGAWRCRATAGAWRLVPVDASGADTSIGFTLSDAE